MTHNVNMTPDNIKLLHNLLDDIVNYSNDLNVITDENDYNETCMIIDRSQSEFNVLLESMT